LGLQNFGLIMRARSVSDAFENQVAYLFFSRKYARQTPQFIPQGAIRFLFILSTIQSVIWIVIKYSLRASDAFLAMGGKDALASPSI
jgi:hypothetical protein